MNNPLVSLLVPVYNVQDYLAECLDSLVNQTLREIEIIIVNDGSTDDSRTIAEEYCEKDSRIKLINQENRGLGAARNVAVPHASGQYILFVDSDDYLDLKTVEILFRRAEQMRTDILVYNGRGFYESSNTGMLSCDIQFKKNPFFKLSEKNEGVVICGLEFASAYDAIAQACMKLYRCSFIVDNNLTFPEGVLGEDMEFNWHSMIKAERVSYIHHFGYFRRYRQDSIMTGGSTRNITDRIHRFPELTNLLELNEYKQYTVLQHKKNLAAQFALYATGLWVVAMSYKDKTIRSELVSACYKHDVCKFISLHKKGFFLWVASIMIALPESLQPLMHIACVVVKIVFRSRTDLFI